MEAAANRGSSYTSASRIHPLGWILNLFSNVWFGVILAFLLFVYCSIGSALPAVRQHEWLEMTEFEWFHWWPFNLVVLLFTATMVVITVRRIPLRPINAGVWMIHAGIVTLVLGSYVYFTAKVEGDAPVFRRHIRIDVPGQDRPQGLVAMPGNETRVAVGPDVWRFRVQSTHAAWPILSEEHQGETAYSVNVMVTPPNGETFIRQLLAGYEQYTEDVLPGQGRAIKAIGKPLVHEDLKLTLDYEPQTYFHVMDTWALYVRRVGETEWVQRPIHGLPRYNDHVPTRDLVFSEPNPPLKLRSLDVPVPPAGEQDPLAGANVHITSYLRFAHMERRWREGGDRLNPVISVSLVAPGSRDEKFELAALDRTHNITDNGLVQFTWLDSAAALDTLPTNASPMLQIAVPDASLDKEIVLNNQTVVGREGAFVELEGTDFAYRVITLQDNLVLPGRTRPVSIAMVEIRTPEKTFRRWVADTPELTRDIHGEGADPHALDTQDPDPRIRMSYRPQTAPLIFAAYPGGVHLVFNSPDGRMLSQPVTVGEIVPVVAGLGVRVDGLWANAVSEMRPYVVPPERRQRDARETFSMIRLEVDSGSEVQTQWVPFNSYALPNEQYAYSGRFAYSPIPFRAPNGQRVEVVFSRERRPLPAPIALEDFALATHLGGYTGAALTIRNYISHLRFWDNGRWTEPVAIAVNNPTDFGGFWYFQSMWDRPQSNDPTGGMNYTGLGVGNRKGVYVQLFGCCLATVGMIFAFYVKPLMKRRRSSAQRARISGEQSAETSSSGLRSMGRPVTV